ncbi:MAG: DegT/DnrJ/EryC1/StrS family aminotransferase [Planctomycetia bacterium]|nr:DegT/DnrJ/EryC1/StrS family aminotransferase [Planctomycetia bacterium]
MTEPAGDNPSDPVPLLDLSIQFQSIREEVLAAILRVVESQHFILGPEVEALEREMAVETQSAHAVGVSSGTDALLVAMMALDIGPGDEVVTTPFSFFATAGCVARLGARPVFVDIDPVGFNMNPAGLEAAITPRTRAIIPVHLYGQTAEMTAIGAIAEGHGLPIIEDAAQAIGAEYHGRRAGSLGAMAALSFFPSKNLGAFGDGGMVTTSDAALADRLRILRNHGFRPKYHSAVVGGNFRLDAIQAAVLRAKLPHLAAWTAARQRNATLYRQLMAEAKLDEQSVRLPREVDGCRHVYHQFVIRVDAQRRDALREHLAQQGIGTEVYYPQPLHLQECFAHLGYRRGDFPHSERTAAESIALPVYPELTPDQQARVVTAIAEFFRAGR